jgi:Diguanylate cyclase, GGDEF domain
VDLGRWGQGGRSVPPATAGVASLPPKKAREGLTELGATIGGPGAVLGAIFVPSPNPGLTSEDAVPDDHSHRYAINHDENTLRLTLNGEVVVAAQRGQDGIYHEVKSGTPIARDVGGSFVFDAATLAKAAAPKQTSRTSDGVVSMPQAEAKEEPQPKLCPDPKQDTPHGASHILADRVVTLLSELYDIEGRHALIGASAGIALAPDDGVTAEQLLRNADMALYQAKGDGRCTFCFFEPGTSARVRAQCVLEPSSHNALAAGEFV